MPLYIQTDRGYSATMSGLIMLPGAIGQCVSQFFGGRAMDRFGARPVALFGSIVLTLGTLGMSLVAMDTWIWWVSICQFIRQDRKSTRLNSSHITRSRMPSSA